MPLYGVKSLKILKITTMLIPDNIHPENTIYYNGAFVLETLKSDTYNSILDLYQATKAKREMSFSIFVLCLDWLYLLNIAQINNKGEIILCS
ncbi:ABC-three component system middle component 6 [Elizabethkingia meningoseptica]|uniref:ABC-three component system middle component 6 n=2 Tax=Elizabethkingia meningoseptica TaxID=238 RepID=UPI00288B300B|nr:ABC-three component system middle component 6 [Elizabethkingia meningoseptica]